MARTTVDIDTPILKEIKDLRKREGRSMGKVMSQLLAEALAQRKLSAEPPSFRWASHPMHARLDLADKDAIYAILDKDEK